MIATTRRTRDELLRRWRAASEAAEHGMSTAEYAVGVGTEVLDLVDVGGVPDVRAPRRRVLGAGRLAHWRRRPSCAASVAGCTMRGSILRE